MIPTASTLLAAAPIFLWLQLLPSVHASNAAGTTVIVTATPTIPHPPSYTSPEIFKDVVLSASNAYRRDHNASQLSWNETLTTYAKHWAEGCKWKHSGGPYGENIAFGYSDPTAAVSAWGDEGQKYNYKLPTGFSEETGHFTQLVWRATREVGCAAFNCGYSDGTDAKDKEGRYTRAQGWYVVCEYSPAGNVVGDQNAFFRVNVQSASTYSGPETTGLSATGTSVSTSASATPTSGVDEVYDGRLRDQYQNAFVGIIVFMNLV
ncbi:cell wall protein PRY3 [Aspergillus udagawae]|nr:cell wall protein PRY3 [Aspergillus udagawae]